MNIIVSTITGASFSILLYTEGAAPVPSAIAGVIAAALAYVIIRMMQPAPQKRSPNADYSTGYHSGPAEFDYQEPLPLKPYKRQLEQPIQRRKRQEIQRINPDYYRPEVALQRFTPSETTVIVGVGCAGINSLDYLVTNDVTGADSIAIDTDLQTLHRSQAGCSLFLGDQKNAAEQLINEQLEVVSQALREAETVILLVGLGGKTGTVVVPAIAREAKQQGKEVHLFAIEPMAVEGIAKSDRAVAVLESL